MKNINEAKYYVNMCVTRRFQMKEYFFETEDEVNDFLMDMNDFELDMINTIEKKTSRGWKNVYDEFLD